MFSAPKDAHESVLAHIESEKFELTHIMEIMKPSVSLPPVEEHFHNEINTWEVCNTTHPQTRPARWR